MRNVGAESLSLSNRSRMSHHVAVPGLVAGRHTGVRHLFQADSYFLLSDCRSRHVSTGIDHRKVRYKTSRVSLK